MLKGFESTWKAAALLTFNTLVLILIANCLSWLVLALLPPSTGPKLEPEALLEAYPGVSESQIRQIQSETWGRDYAYEPFTQFKEGPVQGDFVNVDESGFRQSPDRAPWPPEPETNSVFVFGGSTTFGYGVDDGSTIPVALQRALRASGCADIVVYNLGRSNYFSTQERVLFEQQLLEGHVPSAAVFIDGLNDFVRSNGQPKFSDRLSYFMSETRTQLSFRALKQMPLVRLLRRLARTEARAPVDTSPADQEAAARAILDRWDRNRELIRATAVAHGVATLFVVQPVPWFPVGVEVNPIFLNAAHAIPNSELLTTGYQLLARREETADILWLAESSNNLTDGAYVDRVHYSAAFSAALGDEIATALAPRICPRNSDPATKVLE